MSSVLAWLILNDGNTMVNDAPLFAVADELNSNEVITSRHVRQHIWLARPACPSIRSTALSQYARFGTNCKTVVVQNRVGTDADWYALDVEIFADLVHALRPVGLGAGDLHADGVLTRTRERE